VRGIDVPGINLVANHDAPRQAEDYVHRIGRTGRAGRAGIAVTFLGHADRHLVRQIERFTGNKVSLMRSRASNRGRGASESPNPSVAGSMSSGGGRGAKVTRRGGSAGN